MKQMWNRFRCRIGGHLNDVPIIEVWETMNGWQKSVYLCRRCLLYIGEKPYAE